MSIDVIRQALLWCTVINYGILIVGFLIFALPHGGLQRIWCRVFRMSPERFDAINFAALVLYKIGILLFNMVPYIALRIVA